MEAYGLHLAKEKTEAVFLQSKRISQDFSFNFEGHEIRPAKTVKYLGVTSDSRRSFRQHIIGVTSKSLRYAADPSRLITNLCEFKMATRWYTKA